MANLTKGQIVAFGGGGFAMEPDNPLLDEYVLGLCRSPRPRVCFIPTASGDSLAWLERFYDAFPEDRCEPTHLALFSRAVDDLYDFLTGTDLIYAGGGNTVNLLAIWRAQGLADVLPRLMEEGTIVSGVSAGALCWFERGITDSYGPGLNPLMNGLGFAPGSFCPHFDSDPRRPEAFRDFVARTGEPGIAAEDGVGFHFIDGRLHRTVSSRPHARGWRFAPRGGDAEVTEIEPDYLGAEAPVR